MTELCINLTCMNPVWANLQWMLPMLLSLPRLTTAQPFSPCKFFCVFALHKFGFGSLPICWPGHPEKSWGSLQCDSSLICTIIILVMQSTKTTQRIRNSFFHSHGLLEPFSDWDLKLKVCLFWRLRMFLLSQALGQKTPLLPSTFLSAAIFRICKSWQNGAPEFPLMARVSL